MNNTYYYRQANTRSSQKQLLPVNAIEVFISGSTMYLAAIDFTNDH